MAKNRRTKIPMYRRQRRPHSADEAFVELNGQRHYLGRYGSNESKGAYHKLLAEWTASGGQVSVNPDEITVTEITARFWQHAQKYYRSANGTPTSEVSNIRQSLRPLKQLYGPSPAAQFGPLALKAIRQKMTEAGWCRSHINSQVGRIKRMFKWAASNELVPGSVHHALMTVEGLKRGRCNIRETQPKRPVPETHIGAIKPHVSRQVWALVQLQLLTGARPGELVIIRPIDLDTTGSVWTYKPVDHKTVYRGHERTIYIGPRGEEGIKPFLGGRAVDAFMFSPIEAEAERRAKLHAARKTPTGHGNRPGTNRKASPKRKPRARYTTDSYRRAIERACRAASVPPWTPHRLRHSAGTSIRKEFGLEAAQIMLGHKRADVTQVYAEINAAKAVEIAAKIG